MTRADLQYFADLVRAWAVRPDDPAPIPLPRPADVDAVGVCRLLTEQNVEAALGPYLPASDRTEEFNENLVLSSARTFDLLLECERVLPAVKTAADRPVLLKGASLALEHYPDPAHRWFLDLDILVPQGRVPAVCDNLQDLGYRPLDGPQDSLFYDRHHFHRIMLGPHGSCVEVHWALTLPRSVYRCDPEGVLGRARPVGVGRQGALAPAAADHLLHCAYQNIADGFVDLRRVLDQVVLMRSMTPADWDQTAELADSSGLGRGLALSLHIVKYISGVCPPDGVDFGTRLGATAWRTIRGLDPAFGCLGRSARRVSGYSRLLHLLCTPGNRQRWNEMRRKEWWHEAALQDLQHQIGARAALKPTLGYGLRHAVFMTRLGWLAARSFSRGY